MGEKVGNAVCIVVGSALGAAAAVYSVIIYVRFRGAMSLEHLG